MARRGFSLSRARHFKPEQIWQIELPVVLFILVFFLYHAFREGIWACVLLRETYDGAAAAAKFCSATRSMSPMQLKNDLNKIDWCTALLDEQMPGNREVGYHPTFDRTPARAHPPHKNAHRPRHAGTRFLRRARAV